MLTDFFPQTFWILQNGWNSRHQYQTMEGRSTWDGAGRHVQILQIWFMVELLPVPTSEAQLEAAISSACPLILSMTQNTRMSRCYTVFWLKLCWTISQNLTYLAVKCTEPNFHVLFVKQSKEYQSLCFLLPPSVHQVIGHLNIRVFLCQIITCMQVEQFIWMETGTLGLPMNVWMNTLSQPTLELHLASQKGVHFSD